MKSYEIIQPDHEEQGRLMATPYLLRKHIQPPSPAPSRPNARGWIVLMLYTLLSPNTLCWHFVYPRGICKGQGVRWEGGESWALGGELPPGVSTEIRGVDLDRFGIGIGIEGSTDWNKE